MSDAWRMFLDQAEAERKDKGMTKSELSYIAFNHSSCYREILTNERPRRSVATAQKISDALGLKLVICMVEEDE